MAIVNKKSIISILTFFSLGNCIYAEPLLFTNAYDLALKNSSDIKSSTFKSQADEEQITQAKSQLYPQIRLSGYYKKTDYKANPNNSTVDQGLFSTGITVDQSIYDSSTYSKIEMQKLRSKYSKTKLTLEQQQLAQDLFDTYLNVVKLTNKVESLKVYVEYQHVQANLLEKQYQLSLANKMDLLQAKSQYSSSKVDLSKQTQLLSVYKLKLKQYIGESSSTIPMIDIDKNSSSVLQKMQDSIKKDYKNSAEIKTANVNLEMARQAITNAYHEFLPTVGLELQYNKYFTDTPTIDAPYNSVSYGMINVNIPIFSGGYTYSEIQSSKLQYAAASEDLKSTEKKIELTYNENIAKFDSAVAFVDMYKEAYEAAKLYYESVQIGYQHQLKSIVDVDDAENKLYDVKYKYIDNMYDLVNSYTNIMVSTNSLENLNLLDEILE
jgi:outer membrane protein